MYIEQRAYVGVYIYIWRMFLVPQGLIGVYVRRESIEVQIPSTHDAREHTL